MSFTIKVENHSDQAIRANGGTVNNTIDAGDAAELVFQDADIVTVAVVTDGQGYNRAGTRVPPNYPPILRAGDAPWNGVEEEGVTQPPPNPEKGNPYDLIRNDGTVDADALVVGGAAKDIEEHKPGEPDPEPTKPEDGSGTQTPGEGGSGTQTPPTNDEETATHEVDAVVYTNATSIMANSVKGEFKEGEKYKVVSAPDDKVKDSTLTVFGVNLPDVNFTTSADWKDVGAGTVGLVLDAA